MSWDELSALVLHELERHSEVLERLEEKLDTLAVENAGLKVRVSLWSSLLGALAGLVPAVISTWLHHK